ncbi:TPA: hypothetical protein OWX23_002786, partial [Staphylococcus aureus]|nr:hypothetical protein [Staphylococcus aureus]
NQKCTLLNYHFQYTLNLQQKGVQGTFSLGRVQTPTLYLIYQRQEAIENFKKEPFFLNNS